MNLIPVSYNGHAINSGSYESFIAPQTPIQPPVETLFVPRPGAWPVYAGKSFPESSITIGIKISGVVHTKIEELNNWFSVEDETMHQLIMSDGVGGTQYYVNATCRQAGFMEGQNVYFTLSRESPVWQTVTQDSTSWTITASGDTDTITAAGNAESYPILEITPTGYPSGTWPYVQYVQEYPQSAYAWPKRYLEITGATAAANYGMDTAALIAGGKMQATSDPAGAGGDIRVRVNGALVNYWIGGAGINTTDTRIFITVDQPVKREMTLLTAIASTDTITTVSISPTAANIAAARLTSAKGRFIIDSEEFTYTGRTILSTAVTFTGIEQGVRNTTIASHSAGATVRILPYDIQILYGNLSCAAQVMDDTYKPVISLATSRNDSMVYTDFADIGQKRPGSWKPTIINPGLGRISTTYTGNSNGAEVNPAAVMGMSILAANTSAGWKASTAEIAWVGSFPDACSAVASSSGQKSSALAATTWPASAYLQSSTDGINWINEINETGPATSDFGTFVATTNTASETVPSATRFLRYDFKGTVNGAANNYAKWEISAATVTLVNPPIVTRRAELQIVSLDYTIANTTTGDSIYIALALDLNKTLYIDTNPDAPYARYRGQDVSSGIVLNTTRAKWLPLTALTSNVLSITGVVGNTTIVIKRRERMLFY